MKVVAWISALALAACGGGPAPLLRNVPQPNKAVVAGAAAAIAGAATLAAPDAAAKRQEQNKVPDEKKPIDVKQTVPSDVFDRLEAKPKTGAPGASSDHDDKSGKDDKDDKDDKKIVPGGL